MIYCLDTNVLIEPWNKYYSPDLCPDYWEVLTELVSDGKIFCTDEVKREVLKVDDGLSYWIKTHPEFVRDIDDDVQVKLRTVLQKFPRLVDTKKDRSMADPWVVAHAWSAGATVVTKEMPSNSVTRIKIPDVCQVFKVRCIDDFSFLKEVGISFNVKQNHRGGT
jgi:hypothetical protein